MTEAAVKIGVDIGGTFTDLVLFDPARDRLFNVKVLTTPDDPSRNVLAGIARVLRSSGVEPSQVSQVIHGTTLVANALIERKGVATALVTTAGFRDVLQIGREWRYDNYDLTIDMVEPLVPRSLRFEAKERVASDGRVIEPLDEPALDELARVIARLPVKAVAVSFLHSFKYPQHEQRAKAILERHVTGATVCISSDVMPEIGEYERTSTTIANAYVQPIFRHYITRLGDGLRAMGISRGLYLMQSDGGTVSERTAVEFPIRLVQSGPAGGVQAAALIGRLAGVADTICFDMGGTTAKACLIEGGEPARTTDFEVARRYRFKKGSGIPLKVPVVDMIEIGAGGGSVARVNAMGLIRVGPDSSGAVPGPACYGQGGGAATVTDADLILGYLDPTRFLGGDMVLDRTAAERAVGEHVAGPLALSVTAAAWGIHETVNENMSQAASIHALERGRRAGDFVLVPIGGAGPVHACRVARKMGIRRLVCPAGAGVASAFGFLAAPLAFEFIQASVSPVAVLDFGVVGRLLGDLERRGHDLLREAGTDEGLFQVRIAAAMRYIGQGFEVEVPVARALIAAGHPEALSSQFEQHYRALYGRSEPDMPCEVVSWRVVVSGPRPTITPMPPAGHGDAAAARRGERLVFDGEAGDFVVTAVYDRYRLGVGARLRGPAIIEERESTLVVPAGAEVFCDGHGNVVIDLAS